MVKICTPLGVPTFLQKKLFIGIERENIIPAGCLGFLWYYSFEVHLLLKNKSLLLHYWILEKLVTLMPSMQGWALGLESLGIQNTPFFTLSQDKQVLKVQPNYNKLLIIYKCSERVEAKIKITIATLSFLLIFSWPDVSGAFHRCSFLPVHSIQSKC